MSNSGWARGPEQYEKTGAPAPDRAGPNSGERSRLTVYPQAPTSDRQALTGITWDSAALNLDLITQTDSDRARARFRGVLPSFIWDAAALEGNPYTLPEVQTLLEGTTIGGHRLEDANQILALNDGFRHLDSLLASGTFSTDKRTSDQLHALIARAEALDAGMFRGQGTVGGGGHVNLGEHGTFEATQPDIGGRNLQIEYDDLLAYLPTLDDPREQALAYFASATYRQFYFDGNKRTARTMMAGQLLSHGYDAISISANRRLEFNQHLTTLYRAADATPLLRFVIDSRPSN